MNDKTVKKIQSALDKGDRVLIVPVKDGVRVYVIRREEIKQF